MITPRVNEYTHLERIINELKEIVAREYARPEDCADMTPELLSLLENEIIPVLEEQLDCDPTPEYLYDNTGGEPPVTAEETHYKAWAEHQAMHS